ncbi:MAG: hypothetical protein KBI46_07350 [Phycisphaerae bacterium]|nr:hypothetical protein [Phycisphaerae bacterium]
MRQIKLNYFCIVNILLFCMSSLASRLDPNSVIAFVKERKITYNEIKLDIKYASTLTLEQIKKQEQRRLWRKIDDIIFQEAVHDYHIRATESEIDMQVDETFEKANLSDEQIHKICRISNAIHDALIALYQKPSAAQEIYQEKLSSLISEDDWKTWQTLIDSPEKLKRLVICNDINDLKRNSRESAKNDVLRAKLNKIITKDVNVSEEEIVRAYRKRYKEAKVPPEYTAVHNEIYLELLENKRQDVISDWKKSQYKNKVKIINDEFKES